MENDWLINKTPRSVDQLRLWSDNPRLNPEEKHLNLHHFVEDFSSEQDRPHFIKLIKSIAKHGFIPADPVVVWQNKDNQKYYIAEGNRRVAALKLLRNPEKAPKNIRVIVRQCAQQLNRSKIEKIHVNVAPTFEDAEWYINQRNSTTSLNRNWTREQQQRWIAELYDKYDGDITIIESKTNLTQSELEGIIRPLKIKDFVKLSEVSSKLTKEEQELALSHRFPMTILERFLNLSEAREKWGIEYEGINVNIISNKNSFYNAFSELIKQIVGQQITTRFKKEDLPNILKNLPSVSFEDVDSREDPIISPSGEQRDNLTSPSTPPSQPPNKNIRGNPHRNRLIPSNCKLNTSNHKLEKLFSNLQEMPFKYNHSIAVVLRVFFDLAVLEYLKSEGLIDQIKEQNQQKNLKDITLKRRLEFLNHSSGKFNQDQRKIINKLLNFQNKEYSLDTLNVYVHSQNTHYSSKCFLNGFWDFLFPLLEILLDVEEID